LEPASPLQRLGNTLPASPDGHLDAA